MPLIEIIDPNNANANGRGSASRALRAKGVAQSDGDTAVLLVALVDGNSNTVTSLKTTAGGPAAGQSVKNYCGLFTLTGSPQTFSLETVTTGKTYYITDIVITGSPASAINVQIQAAGVAIFQGYVNATKGLEAIGIETQPFALAGQAVTLVVPAGSGSVAFNIGGIEQ
jgi:hypothetical protein